MYKRFYETISLEDYDENIDVGLKSIMEYADAIGKTIEAAETIVALEYGTITEAKEKVAKVGDDDPKPTLSVSIKRAINKIFEMLDKLFTKGAIAIKARAQAAALDDLKNTPDVEITIVNFWKFDKKIYKSIDTFIKNFKLDPKTLKHVSTWEAGVVSRSLDIAIRWLRDPESKRISSVYGATRKVAFDTHLSPGMLSGVAKVPGLFGEDKELQQISTENTSTKVLYQRLKELDPTHFHNQLYEAVNKHRKVLMTIDAARDISNAGYDNTMQTNCARLLGEIATSSTKFRQALIDYYIAILKQVKEDGGAYDYRKLGGEYKPSAKLVRKERETREKLESVDSEEILEEKAKTARELGPKTCSKCGSSNIGVYLRGEPVYICNDCKKYLGTVPFTPKTESVDTDFNTFIETGVVSFD